MAFNPLQLVLKYIRFYAVAKSRKGHGIHSPFVFDFAQQVLCDKRFFYAYEAMEKMRSRLMHDNSFLPVEDYGAGSGGKKITGRTVAQLANKAAKSPALAQLLFRIVNHYQPDHLLELGTSLGISTGYMAMARPSARVVTIEGAAAIANKARQNFSDLGITNIEQHTGSFDEVLPKLLPTFGPVDLVFIDGNHRKAPTLLYFEQLLTHIHPGSILIFDDIHWSAEMEAAWDIICQHDSVRLSIDLFHLGLVFFREEFKVKQHFRIRY